jgi:predicted CoA-binding protein
MFDLAILIDMITQNFFNDVKTVAVVGLSDKHDRPSYEVASYLQSVGFKIIPVNPNYTEILGEKVYPDLLSIPQDIKIDVIDIFRKSEDVMPHVEEAVKRGDAHTIWLQEGIKNDDAEQYATSHGFKVFSDFCLMKTHKKTNSN